MAENKTQKKLNKAKANFAKNNDIKAFYNRIIQAATNDEDKLLPAKVHPRDQSRYPNEDAYERSLAPAVAFSEKYPPELKKDFDVIIYHKSNSDGVVSAFIAWDYITDGGEEAKPLSIFRLTPDRMFGNQVAKKIQGLLPRLKGKKVILFDLFYNRATYEAINNVASIFIAIDDHHSFNKSLVGLDYRFSIKGHATCAAAWKFFHPKKLVPYYVQYIDAGDSRGHFKWLPQINSFMTVMAVRFVKNQKKPEYQKDPERLFADMKQYFKGNDVKAINFLVVVGQIMNEIRDNLKAEIAETATKATFVLEGRRYPTYVINFSAPGLTKTVLKNIAAKHPEVPFVVSWFYNHNYSQFDVTLSSAHADRSSDMDLGQLAQKLGRAMGGSGGGHKDSSHVTFKGKIGALDKFIQ
jgi:hypothetical protein